VYFLFLCIFFSFLWDAYKRREEYAWKKNAFSVAAPFLQGSTFWAASFAFPAKSKCSPPCRPGVKEGGFAGFTKAGGLDFCAWARYNNI